MYGSIHIYAPQYITQMLTGIQWEIDIKKIMVGTLTFHYTNGQNIQTEKKETEALNEIINHS